MAVGIVVIQMSPFIADHHVFALGDDQPLDRNQWIFIGIRTVQKTYTINSELNWAYLETGEQAGLQNQLH
jgi:hypothetical protein